MKTEFVLTSLSPNQVVANLLEEFMKKTYPKAAMRDPIVTNSNKPVGVTICLSQAPIKLMAPPSRI